MRIRKKPAQYTHYLHLMEDLMSDAEQNENGAPQAGELVEVQVTFLCPPGFNPKAFLIAALNETGQSFINAPTTQLPVALRLGTVAMDYVSQQSVLHMLKQDQTKPLIEVPPGVVPPWAGPVGRG